jgi:hypothetical protein
VYIHKAVPHICVFIRSINLPTFQAFYSTLLNLSNMNLDYSVGDTAKYISALEPDDKTACTSAIQRFRRSMAAEEFGSIRGDMEEAVTLIERGKARFESQRGQKDLPTPYCPRIGGTPCRTSPIGRQAAPFQC